MSYNQSIIPSTDVIQLTLTLKMTTAQIVETSVTVNNNSPIQDYVHPDDQTQPTFEMTAGFKPFTRTNLSAETTTNKHINRGLSQTNRHQQVNDRPEKLRCCQS